jgi:hypothetical protein
VLKYKIIYINATGNTGGFFRRQRTTIDEKNKLFFDTKGSKTFASSAG